MTRRAAIKQHYRWLHGGNLASVRNCSMYGHPLWPYRCGRRRNDKPEDGRREPDVRTGADYRFDTPMQPAKAIRATCLDCVETLADVRDCNQIGCPLWPYRMGRGKIAPDSGISKANMERADKYADEDSACSENAQIGLFSDDDSTLQEPRS